MWDAIEKVYGVGSEAELTSLTSDFNTFVMRQGESMESLHKRLTKLIRQMEDLGQDTTDVQKRRAFLNAVVDKNWEETVMRIREQSAGMSSLEVFQRLQGVEKQLQANAKMRKLHGASSSNIGLASIPAGKGDKGKGKEYKNNTNQNGADLTAPSTQNPPGGGSSTPTTKKVDCYHCGKRGHTTKECRLKAAGKPQTTDGKKKFEEFMKMKEEKIKKHLGLAISNVDSNKDEVEIIVDTGAQPSIIKDKGLLSNLITKSSTLHQVNGSVKSVGKGDFIVKNDLPPLKNSIFVPNSSYNLLSVGQMSDSWNCSTVFDSDGFRTIQGQIRIPDEKLILEGERSKDGLYKVRKLQKEKEKPVKNVVNDEQSERTQNLKIGTLLLNRNLALQLRQATLNLT